MPGWARAAWTGIERAGAGIAACAAGATAGVGGGGSASTRIGVAALPASQAAPGETSGTGTCAAASGTLREAPASEPSGTTGRKPTRKYKGGTPGLGGVLRMITRPPRIPVIRSQCSPGWTAKQRPRRHTPARHLAPWRSDLALSVSMMVALGSTQAVVVSRSVPVSGVAFPPAPCAQAAVWFRRAESISAAKADR